MCLFPRLLTNKKYTGNKKNGGIIPPVNDHRVIKIAAGCGNCIECSKQKAREWQVRLLEDIKEHTNGKFITLTFSNEWYTKLNNEEYQIHKNGNSPVKIPISDIKGYDKDNAIATRAVRLFLERWRKKYKKSLRHWLVTELGHQNTENIHLHGIVWTNEDLREIESHWKYGYVWTGKRMTNKMNGRIEIVNYVNERTVNYITKYVTKKDQLHKTYKPIILTSAGIGRSYINNRDSKQNAYNGNDTKEYYRTRSGHKIAMPIYWRNKIYTEEEREKLWLQKLDKEERWINGVKIDVSETDRHYWNVLEQAREKNKRLGYGSDNIDWNRKKYEMEIRDLKQKARMDNNNKDEQPS